MDTEHSKRKLAAILSADVVGYSRLMEDDEETTVSTITAYREVIVGSVEKHSGQVVDAKGDSVLAEFPSALNALRSAVEIQNELEKRNFEVPSHRKMQFRIGVNLGDVIEDGGTIYGDGVNIAARLEGLAKGGGICISSKVFEEVKRKSGLGFKYLGKHTVKNISEPVSAYAVLTKPKYEGKVIGEQRSGPKKWKRTALGALVGLILLGGGFSVWNYLSLPPDVEPASVEKMAFPLPEKPSIAVLAFDNMSGDSKQVYFSDGISEGIITALSSVPEVFVIARNSAFTYKGKPVMIKKVQRNWALTMCLKEVFGDPETRCGSRLSSSML